MKIVTHDGPYDGRTWDYKEPLPDALMCYDPATGYHEYHRVEQRNYEWVGFTGTLPL